MIDVYKIYNFKFDKDIAIEGLRQALIDKGLDDKHKFVDFVLKYYPKKSKATLEEYYTRRLCSDNEILKLLHDELKINLQESMLPNSSCKCKVIFEDPSIDGRYIPLKLGIIDTVLYNSNKLNKDSNSEEFEDYFNSLHRLTIDYCYYNYLIQKYADSNLSKREKEILDLYVNTPLTSKTAIYKFIDDNKGKPNILKLYYESNTLCIFANKKHYLLDYVTMFDMVPDEKIVDLLCLIPPKEKNILYTIYKNLNNEKMIKALNNFNVREIKNIEIINNNLFDTLNSLIDKEVL